MSGLKKRNGRDEEGGQVLWTLLMIGVVFLISSVFYLYVLEGSSDDTLVLYSGRSRELISDVVDEFEEETGIDVEIQYGSTTEIASTLLEEGEDSPADVFYAQDPGGIGSVQHMLRTLPQELLEQAPEEFHSAQDDWVGISGRARVVVYNTEELKEEELPDDMWAFTESEWEGRIGWAPSNPSFQTMVTAMRAEWGEEETEDWLEAIQENDPVEYTRNTPTVQAVADGEVDVGFVNHYYLYRFLEEEGEEFPARNYYPDSGGPGTTMMISGAGILESSDNEHNAERFLEFLLSENAQEYFAEETFEYPVREGIETYEILPDPAEIDFPDITMEEMDDLEGTLDMLRSIGVIS